MRTAARLPALILLIFACTNINAQKPQVLPPPSPEKTAPTTAQVPQAAQVTPQLTRQDLESFFDGFIPIQLQRDDIAGAVVAVVKDGNVLFAKGYGYSDVKAGKPVTVDATLFRPGSISKTFTWTAVMQLYEQGKLDLDRDVNDYLDFKIPARFGKPVTMKDLMTHTPGFEETLRDLFVEKASDMSPLAEYVRTHEPKEIFPPGTTPAYSNYGATLAGYIVQRVSGMPFDDYIERNIFQPLGMQHSTFRQPLPEALKPLMSQGYNRASQPPKDFEFVQAWPAGSLSTTAEDMTHYILAHLNNGEYNAARILKPETAQLMHSRLFGLAPELNGMAYGFYEESRNGHRIIGHGGDSQWFHSDMHLMPDDHIGFFISYNSLGKPGFSGRTAVWQSFLNRYFSYTPPAGQKVANAAQDAKSAAGTYWLSRRSETNVAAVTGALDQSSVTVNSDGTISLDRSKDFAGNPKRYEEIAPMLFREVRGQSHLLFTKDYAGRRILLTDIPVFVFQPVPALKNQNLNLGILIGDGVIMALTLLFWPINAMLRWHYSYRAELTARYRKLRFWMRVVCLVDLAFMAGFGLWLSSVDEDIALLGSRFDPKLHAMQAVGLLGVVGTLIAINFCLRSWRTQGLWFWTKTWNTLLMLACLGFTFFLLNWHVLNFRLNY
ncbi:MAG TPA: serine hydrolase domain-containing protein [Terriglobales bacterium]|nr:serine hydrolase domain-containing protein [Terriglobales bacterium]